MARTRKASITPTEHLTSHPCFCSASASPQCQRTNPVAPFLSRFSRVRDVTLIKRALKPPAPRPSPAPFVATKDPHLFRGGDGVCRRQVCGSCSYLWANTGCLFSAGKYRLLYKRTRRWDVRADLVLFTKPHVRLIFFFLLFAPLCHFWRTFRRQIYY